MAERNGELSSLIEARECLMQRRRLAEIEHRRLAAGHHDGVESVEREGRMGWVFSTSAASFGIAMKPALMRLLAE
jgi:hypothetical protein